MPFSFQAQIHHRIRRVVQHDQRLRILPMVRGSRHFGGERRRSSVGRIAAVTA
jgi:hypothetical protein